MKNFFSKNKITLAIVAIIAVSLFLRLYHLSDWLHFQLDQSRDSFLIKEVFQNGIADLPLLGPRAGGSFLRLGPAYYYLMYLFVLVTRSFHPIVFVLPEIIGSIAFIPMFYLLARRLLSERWSLILTFLTVSSTFLITYDRFSWNPNLLPLFSTITIYAWLKYLEAKRKSNHKNSLMWIALVGLAAGILTQLHFVAFVAVPIILISSAAILGLSYRIYLPGLAKKYFHRLLPEIGILIATFILVNTPIILNEYVSHGINTKQLFATVNEKGGKDVSHNLPEKLIQNLWVYPKGYFITLTGVDTIDFPVWRLNPKFDIVCDDKCRKSFTPTLVAAIIFIFLAASFSTIFLKKTKQVTESDKTTSRFAKNIAEWEFLVLLILWVVVPWWAFYSLSFTLRPRFFLFSIVPFWIVTGLLLRELSRGRLGKKVTVGLVALIFASNIANTVVRFNRLAGAEAADAGSYPQDQILFQDESYPVTLVQQRKIADWIIEKSPSDIPYVFLWAPSYYYRPILYLMNNSILKDKTRYMSGYPQVPVAGYFAISRTAKPEKFFHGANAELFQVADRHAWGTLTVYQLELTEKGRSEAQSREKKFLSNERLTADERIKQKCLTKPKPSCRYTWKDLFLFLFSEKIKK